MASGCKRTLGRYVTLRVCGICHPEGVWHPESGPELDFPDCNSVVCWPVVALPSALWGFFSPIAATQPRLRSATKVFVASVLSKLLGLDEVSETPKKADL